jgi:hypothetical protein
MTRTFQNENHRTSAQTNSPEPEEHGTEQQGLRVQPQVCVTKR